MFKTYIFDIDNTICDTWPTLNVKKENLLVRFLTECWRVSVLPSFQNMIKCLKVRKYRENCDVYFLSARHWSLWLPTYIYLIRTTGLIQPNHLILVPNAIKKVEEIEKFLILNKNNLVIVDDLSYNTEFGETLYYTDVINYIYSKKCRIKYIGKKKIDAINRINY